MDAAVAGLIGAGIGAGTSLATVWIQAHFQAKREKAKTVLELAMRARSEELLEGLKLDRDYRPEPLAVHVTLQQRLLALVEKQRLTTKAVTELYDDCDKLSNAIENANANRPIRLVISKPPEDPKKS